jgi:dihydrofolate synthase/folylpolyglutamate synthase
LDGGHNPDGGKVLAAAMADFEERASRPLVMIVGMLGTKDSAGFLLPFAGLAGQVMTIPIKGNVASRSAAEVAALAEAAGLPAVPCAGVEEALRLLRERQWRVAPRVLIAGSLYLAGEVLSLNGTVPT